MTDRSDLKKRIRARQAKTRESYSTARMHVLGASDPDSNTATRATERITAIVVKCNQQSLRLRNLGTGDELTFRCSGHDAWTIAPAQLVEISIGKRWTWRDDAYASGTIERIWTDVPALNLTPLALEDYGLSDLRQTHDPVEEPDPYAAKWAETTSSPRRVFEFDGIAWSVGLGPDQDDEDTCPIADAAEMHRYDPDGAREQVMDVLLDDLRCIDAHAHLGSFSFDER